MVAALIVVLAAVGAFAQSGRDRLAPKPIVALDPRWTVELAAPPSAPIGFDSEAAYVPQENGDLLAVALDDGTLRWSIARPTTSRPATGDGLIFVASDTRIHALDQTAGTEVWRLDLEAALAAPLHWDAGWLFTSTAGGELIAIHAQDGRVAWRLPIGAAVARAPMAAGEHVYAALGDGRVAAVHLETGAVQWLQPMDAEITGLLALDDQLIVGTRANRVHSLSLSSGRIRWTQRVGGDIIGTPAADAERIYFVAMDNVARGLDRDSGSIEWTRPVASRATGGPLLVGELVFVPLVTTDITVIAASTGQLAFAIKAVSELGAAPFLRETVRPTAVRLVAVGRDGKLQGFAPRYEPVPALLPELPGIKVAG